MSAYLPHHRAKASWDSCWSTRGWVHGQDTLALLLVFCSLCVSAFSRFEHLCAVWKDHGFVPSPYNVLYVPYCKDPLLRKAKIKEKMVGMVKFGGGLVSRGLVPPEGVMAWIHTLLSEKTQEVFCREGDEETDVKETEKDVEQREVQLEVLCAILASMGSSLADPTVWNEDHRMVIENVFEQLETLSTDAEHLSLRIRCLILDLPKSLFLPVLPINVQNKVQRMIYMFPSF